MLIVCIISVHWRDLKSPHKKSPTLIEMQKMSILNIPLSLVTILQEVSMCHEINEVFSYNLQLLKNKTYKISPKPQ